MLRSQSNPVGRLAMAAGVAVVMGALGACENMDWTSLGAKPSESFVKPGAETKEAKKPAPRPPLTKADQQREEMNQAALDTQAAFDMMNAKTPENQGDKAPAIEPARKRPQSRAGRAEPLPSLSLPDLGPATTTAAAPENRPNANRSASVSDATVPSSLADRTAEQRKADAIAELAQQLRPGIDAAKQPLRAAVPLFGLESMSVGSAHEAMDAIRAGVSPDQRRVIDATAELFRTMASDPNLASAEPSAVAAALRSQADRLMGGPQTDGEDLSLGAVAICQQVDGFGRYTPLRSNAFMAGRTGSMILYTEVDHFAQTPVAEGEDGPRWSVELGQSVKLFFDADNSEQMVLPETVVKDQSRAKRRDFFLVQRIDLPRTLSVGNYTLKVMVRDLASGGYAEQLTPIRVIADGSVAGNQGQSGMDQRPRGQGKPNKVANGTP